MARIVLTTRGAATRVVTLIMLAACGGDAGVTGPDEFGAHTIGTITVTSGTSQVANAGQAVAVAPVVHVTSERGRPLRGATITLAAENGRGALDATSAVSNETGDATLPRWVAPLSAGEFAVAISAPGAAGAQLTARVTASVPPDELSVVTQSIGTGGGTIAVTTPASALNGFSITVPRNALTTATTFIVTSSPIPTLPASIVPASPVIGLDGPLTRLDSAMTIRLPGTRVGTAVLGAYLLTDDNQLVPIPTHSSDATSVTVLMRQLTPPVVPVAAVRQAGTTGMRSRIRLILANWQMPTGGTFTTGFRIGVNNIAASNGGSTWEPGGFCAGSSVLNGVWFRVGRVAARTQFPTLLSNAETPGWLIADQLSPVIRLATALQGSYGPNLFTTGFFKQFYDQSHKTTWENVSRSIALFQEPVYLAIRSNAGGHAIVAYKVDLTGQRIFVADPNFPDDTNRVMQYRSTTQKFDSFPSAQSLQSGQSFYDRFADATWFFREEAPTIATTINEYIATGLRTRFVPVVTSVKRKSNVAVPVTSDVTSLSLESRDRELRLIANDFNGTLAWVQAGVAGSNGTFRVFTPVDTLRVSLLTGLNKIGIVFFEQDAQGNGFWRDAKLLQVTRADPAIKFLTQPVTSNKGQSLGQVRIGFVDEDGVLVPEQRTITVALSGGASGAVLAGATNLRTGIDGSVTLGGLSVDKPGTGYTLTASSTGIAAVSSSSFNVTDGGTFTGRVFDVVTTNGIDGVLITVRGADGAATSTGTSAGGGNWTVSGVPAGTSYSIFASKTGYVSTSLAAQTMTLPSTIIEPIPLVPNNTPGGISGNIRNASTTNLITTAVTVELRGGLNNTTSAITASVTTSSGTFTFANVPAGAYTIVARATGFTDGSRTGVVVGAGTTVGQQDVLLSASAGAARVVLTWGASPSDLDSHFTGPTAGSSARFWIYYSGRGNCAASPFVCLDVDDVSAFGPETITLSQITSGVYRYYVYDYTNRSNIASTQLGASGARVQFYVGNTLLQTFFVPGGVGNAWAVFEWNGTALTVLNNLYTISGVPQPAIVATPSPMSAAEEEFRQLMSRTPPKPPQE